MTSIEVWDTGMSQGVVRAIYTPDTLPVIAWKVQFEGGLDAVVETLANGYDHNGPPDGNGYPDELVCEKFRPMPRAYKANEWESLRVEGALAMWAMTPITWQYNDQLLIGGMSQNRDRRRRTAENKRAADDVLREMGLWTTGKEIGMKDANDVNSAMKHLIAYLRNHDHQPTLDALHAIVR